MAKIYRFPCAEERKSIHTIIQHFARGKCSRSDAEAQIVWIMRKYGISKLNIDNFTVKLVEMFRIPIVIIEGKEFSEKCPACGCVPDGHARYLRTQKENLEGEEDCITVTCLECGAIYNTMAPNGRRSRA